MHGTPHVNFVFDAPQRHRHDTRSEFDHALQGAQAAMMSSLLASSGHGGAAHGPPRVAQQHAASAGPLVWRQAAAAAGHGGMAPQAGLVASPATAAPWGIASGPANWRGDQQTCGCEGNISAMMPTNWAGVPLSAFDFMPQPFGMPGLQGGMPWQGQMGHGMHGAPHGAPFGRPPGMPGMGSHGMGMPPGASHSHAPQGHGGHGAAAHAPHGAHGGMNAHQSSPHPLLGLQQAAALACGHDHGNGHGDHTFISLDGIDMVHAKDEIRAGEFLMDDTFYDRLASGQYGAFSGVSLNMDEDGNLDGQVYISGHPAAFHKLYNEGREKGLTGEELNQFIAEELTNVNDIDDIDDRYYEYWESLGVPRPVKDHDLHNIGAIAITLAPGQTASLTGAHTYDTLTDPKYNFTDVKNDARGTFIEFYRLSNNDNSGNGHHEDLAAAARIYLSQSEIGRIATGTKPIDIVNERFKVNDDAADYRISPAAVRMLAAMQMPVY